MHASTWFLINPILIWNITTWISPKSSISVFTCFENVAMNRMWTSSRKLHHIDKQINNHKMLFFWHQIRLITKIIMVFIISSFVFVCFNKRYYCQKMILCLLIFLASFWIIWGVRSVKDYILPYILSTRQITVTKSDKHFALQDWEKYF